MSFMKMFFGSKDEQKPEGFPLPLKFIQTIRLAMALLENNPQMRIRFADKGIFDHLNKYLDYPVTYYKHDWEVRKLDDISFNHEKPSVTVGPMTTGLIFPRQMLALCASKWQNGDKISFTGVKTKGRVSALKTWLKDIYDVDVALEEENTYSHDNICISWSLIGRQWPQKAWDQDYYDSCLTSGFVLCPNGDFVWTYRFFEAVVCGAIPIIEEMCPLYEGFFFYDMKTPRDELIYYPQKAEENFKLLMQKFTLPEKTNAR